MLRRSSLTWNSAPLLDAVVLVLFMHVGYIFLSHPFALGLDVLEDYYGGKGYILFLQALLAYPCLSSLKTTSHELGKVLKMRYTPDVLFKYDHSQEYGQRIDSLLREVGADNDGDDQ